MSTTLYPGMADEKKLAPSAGFKQQAISVVISIILFVLVYIILVIASIALAVGCFYGGIAIIAAMPRLIVIVAGVGLMALGVSIVFFLIKFVFAVTKNDNKGRVQVTEQEQPALFAFIREITKETKTPFPKKIFLSPDVNACVFYNSSFWSMFLPVRKNLEIGLGLVNTLNVNEFKAVMAHEFGHFSQRSMKLGSFTYQVNNIIYNMLFENNSYTNFLNVWANLHSVMAFFAGITVKIAEGIQWILRGMYKLINKNYLGLSREMEFHADAIAASVAGGNNVISGLSRIQVAQGCYNTALNKANELLRKNKISGNIFSNQLTVLQSVAVEHQLALKQGLPEISFQFLQTFSASRLNYKNQWASHPTLEERKAHLDQFGVNGATDDTRAWTLFTHAEALQEKMTAGLYESVKLTPTVEVYTTNQFEEWQKEDREKYSLPAVYKGFYDGRFINTTGWKLDEMANMPVTRSFDELFSATHAQLHTAITNNENDLAVAKAIKEKQIDITSFDFDGVKYAVKDIDDIISILEKDIAKQKEELASLDKEAFTFFYHKGNGDVIKKGYADFITAGDECNRYMEIAQKAMQTIEPLYGNNLTLDEVNTIVINVKQRIEPELKKAFDNAVQAGVVTEKDEPALYNEIKRFAASNYVYFNNDKFYNDELNDLRSLAAQVAEAWNEYKYSHYKKLLQLQASVS